MSPELQSDSDKKIKFQQFFNKSIKKYDETNFNENESNDIKLVTNSDRNNDLISVDDLYPKKSRCSPKFINIKTKSMENIRKKYNENEYSFNNNTSKKSLSI